MAGITLARELAYDAFAQIMDKSATPEEAIDALYQGRGKGLKRVDRNLIKEMLFGSLRWYSKIYWILQNTSNRNLDDSSAEVRAALVLGTYQIFYMDKVPDRAAVNESVEYVRKKGQANATKFINGILRQISRRAEYFTKPDKKAQPVEYLSLQFAHPNWLVARWSKRFKFEKLAEMLPANNRVPPWSIRINTAKLAVSDAHDLQGEFLREERTHSDRRPLRCALRLKESPHLREGSLFAKGLYSIQDEASQLIGFLVKPEPDQTIVDACAGRGGKLGHLFELSEGKSRLTAVESDAKQMAKGQENLERLGHQGVEWVAGSFLEYKPKSPLNKILLDAPCSGLGVLRRHPDGKWHKRESLIPGMVKSQRQLLSHAVDLLVQGPAGGEIVYSVCSFEPEETRDQLAWLLEQYGDKIEVISPVQRLPDYYKRYVTRDHLLLIYAGNQDDMDGFGAFIVRTT